MNMAHYSLTPAAIPFSSSSTTTSKLSFHRVCACLKASSHEASDTSVVNRRSVAFGLVGVVLGANLGEKNAIAAGRRPPPPPPVEKKDPNVTGLAAKLLASKKRKEAMEQEVARLREKGKPVVP